MRKNLRKFLLFLFLLALVSIARFPYQHFGQKLYRSIQAALKQNGIGFSAKEAILSFPAIIRFSNAELKFNSEFLEQKVRIDSAFFRLKILPLLLLQQTLEGQVEGLRGNGKVYLKKFLFADSYNSEFEFNNLDLTRLPLKTIGSFSGSVNIEGRSKSTSSSQTSLSDIINSLKFDLVLQLSKGSYSGGDKIKGIFTLPAADNISLESETSFEGKKLRIKYLSFFSSLGSLRGNGRAGINSQSAVETINMQFNVKLTEQGAKHFGAYLALAANLPPGTQSKNWQLKITKKNNDPLPRLSAAPV